MTDHDITLDPEAGLLDRNRWFTDSAIWTYGLVGLAILIMTMTVMWESTGFLTDPWSGGRLLVVLVAALYGLGLGWILFPRLLRHF